ncbi:unnamed protein product [Larinioides sclopetarius]|uniref:Uncharacterized protein n=1 Tax=Larinioides sclopetarius TaxID=280406 RepID=A0AAV2BRU1_9ARAC
MKKMRSFTHTYSPIFIPFELKTICELDRNFYYPCNIFLAVFNLFKDGILYYT